MAVVSKSNFLKASKGFTLIEMLVVIVILGLFSTLAFPHASEIISNQRLESTAKEIVSDLKLAQQRAISKEISVRVIMNEGVASNPPNTYFIKEVNGSTIKTVKLPRNISFYISHTFDFSNAGDTPNRTIQLINKSNNKFKYIVIYKSGRIRISDKPPS